MLRIGHALDQYAAFARSKAQPIIAPEPAAAA
jgi:hypothetical protein